MGRLIFGEELRALDKQIRKQIRDRQNVILFGGDMITGRLAKGELVRWIYNGHEMIGRVIQYLPELEVYHIVNTQNGELRGLVFAVPERQTRPGSLEVIHGFCEHCGRYDT